MVLVGVSCVDDMCPRFTPSGISVTDLLTPWAWDVTLADITFLLVEVKPPPPSSPARPLSRSPARVGLCLVGACLYP